MKPLNIDEPGCNFTTSNCVIWQGPDISCINLCKGDTVSDVTFALATKICEILHTLNIDTYDLSCFNLTSCKPTDFEQLLQFLLERVCKLESCTGCIPDCSGKSTAPIIPTTGLSGCPDCIVPISECFFFNNALGDQVTAMQLKDYLILIGNTLCGYFATVGYLQKTVSNLAFRVGVLEVAPPTIYIPPTVTPSCVLPPVPTEIDILLTALEVQFCQLRGATGLPVNIYQSISVQPSSLNTELRLSGSGTMGTIPGWFSTVSTEAQSIANMWNTILDMRNAIKNIKVNCCPGGCDGIDIILTAKLVGSNLTIYPSGTIPAGFLQCDPLGTIFKVTDSSGSSVQYTFNLIANLNAPAGYMVDLGVTPVNPALDLTISMTPCLTNSELGATCESCVEYVLSNSVSCPNVIYTSEQTSIQYNFTSAVGPYTYTVQLWDNLGITLLASQVIVSPTTGPHTGIFTGLGIGTNYKLRVVVVPTGCEACVPVTCPFETIATSPQTCAPPESVTISIDSPIVYLGRACGFGAIAGSAITNTGTTIINGNLGLDPGSSVSGGPVVTGLVHVNDTAAINAKNDLILAYNQAASAPVTTNLTGLDLGGMVLTPGVYFFSSSAQITGALVLNGAGTYIFQIGTTLVTNGGVNVVLTGGATADQVFWQVGTSATLGTSTTFKGIVMALSSITINGGIVDGALMARNGALTFTAGTTVNYIGC